MTILSRVLGLWRFRLMAGIFGATGVADAFNFAFIFPNLTRRLFGEGALTSALEPIMMVGVGGMVGVVLIAMYLPVFSLAGNIKGD